MKACLVFLLAIHLLAAMAGFVAAYPPAEQHRENAWEAPGARFPLGTDGLGRDQWSRLVHGARISLYSGLAAGVLSAGLGLLLGGVAGLLGGWVDRMVTRLMELFLALPWMYLLLAARAFFPLETDARVVFTALLLLLGAIGWARPARLVRGIVMSVKERESVLAARGFGAGQWYLLRRHIVPETLPALATYLSLAIPQYVAAEVTLSFLGLGFSGSTPSWGSLVGRMGSLDVLTDAWWMGLPAVVLAVVFGCYSILSSALAETQRQGR